MKALLALMLFLGSFSPSRALPLTLCKPAESVIFSCPSDHDVISVCASPDWDPNHGTLSYRFGRKTASAFSLTANPKNTSPSSVTVTSRLLNLTGGSGAYLRFTNKRYSYIVYDIVSHNSRQSDGAAV